ncbi:MAG TPA: thermonuclease family protein [Rhizomicrobium sp.]|nr:thermonuclease family protein [Rhizomicrobium sp.]
MRIRTWTYGAILAAMCWPRDANAATQERFISDCAGPVKLAHAQAVGVAQDGTLNLRDGRNLVLEGIRLPLEDGGSREQALAALRAMTSVPVNFTAPAPQSDRYGRMRVQGFGREWLQVALLEQGLARVMIAPDRNECAPDLYEAEARARNRHAGLWARPAYQPRAPKDAAAGSFQLVEGRVANVARTDGQTVILFDGHAAFAAVIAAGDSRAFRNFDFDELSGRNIRVRGVVQAYHGRLRIALSSPSQIELLE